MCRWGNSCFARKASWIAVVTAPSAMGQVHFVANPGGGVLFGIPSLEVMRGADHARRRGDPFGGRSPSNAFVTAIILLHPDGAQGLVRRHVTQPGRAIFGIDG